MTRLTKYGHACVRLTKDDGTLLIDPGALTPEDVLADAPSVVLITHEHFDHLDIKRLTAAAQVNPAVEIWTCPAVAAQLEGIGARVHTVREDDTFTAAGFEISVHGERHAVIHPDIPVVENIGFLIDGTVFHPGDAFTVPELTVDTLLVPTNAPWMKASEMIDYVRELRPTRAYSIHDGLLNDNGLKLVDGFLDRLAKERQADYRRLAAGETVDL